MSTIIIVFAIALIIGSMFWVLPSPRERHKMKLRQAAIAKGMAVRLSQLDNPSNPGEKIHCVAYRLDHQSGSKQPPEWFLWRLPAAGRMEQILPQWVATRQTQPSPKIVQALEGCLDKLPKDTVALEQSTKGVAYYWREQGSETDVVEILKTLEGLKSLA